MGRKAQGDAVIKVFVPGIPQPQGSKVSRQGPHQQFPVVLESNPKVEPWRQAIAKALGEHTLWFGEIVVELVFKFPRPLSHYGTGRNAGKLKDGKQYASMITKPDLDKLIRAVDDACTHVLWHDDSQITEVRAAKFYVQPDEEPGVLITVWNGGTP